MPYPGLSLTLPSSAPHISTWIPSSIVTTILTKKCSKVRPVRRYKTVNSVIFYLIPQVDKFTLTAELQLYCGNEWARDVIQSVFTVGAMIGLFVMNLISDTKGRKIATVISLVFMCAGILSNFIDLYSWYHWRIGKTDSFVNTFSVRPRDRNVIFNFSVLCFSFWLL